MKKKTLVKGLTVCLLFATTISLSAQNWKLIWSDEFTTTIGPDWVFETGNNNGWGNSELETYTDHPNASIVNGELLITAQKETNNTVTSIRMKTQGHQSWKYGKVEARIKLPLFKGAFPAFWMLGDKISNGGWPKCGEIDIMENINNNQMTYGTIHYDNGGWTHTGNGKSCNPGEYHVYAMSWDLNYVRWYLDDVEWAKLPISDMNIYSEFHDKFFILLNLAYGSSWASSEQPGATIANFPATPQVMAVDYVRVYQNDVPTVCGIYFTPIPAKIEAEDYCEMSGITSVSSADLGGGSQVTTIEDGDWMGYGITVPTAGKYTINYRVASTNGGNIQLEEKDGSAIYGTVAVPATGGLDTWQTISQTVTLPAGNHSIAVKALVGGFNLNWIEIQNDGVLKIEAEDYDDGGSGISFSDATVENQGNAYRTDAVDIEAGASGFNVGYITAGEWLQYTIPSLSAGSYNITIPLAAPAVKAGQSINIKLDGVSVGKITPISTGGWTTYQNVTISNVQIATSGAKVMRLEFAVGDFNIDYVKFSLTGTTSLGGYKSNDYLIDLYPSPVSDVLHVTSEYGNIEQVDVVSISGAKVLTVYNQSTIDMSALQKGMYLIMVKVNGETAIKKVFKN